MTRERLRPYKAAVMRIGRPLRWPLAAVAATAVALVAGCGDDGGDGADANPKSLLATAASKKIESADVRLRTDANIPNFPILGSRLVMTGSGPVVSNGPDALPSLDWDVLLRAGGQSFPAKVTSVDGRVFVEFMGVPYEAEPELLGQLGIDGEAGNGGAVSLKQLGIDPDGWLTKTKVSDGEEIGGDSTSVVTGTVDKQAVVDDLLAILDSKQLQEQLDSASGDSGLPKLDKDGAAEAADAVKDVEVEVNVDDEGYPRRIYAKLGFDVPESVKDAAFEGGTVSFELVLAQIGGVAVNVQPPVDPDPLSSLFKFAGVIFDVDELSDFWTVPR